MRKWIFGSVITVLAAVMISPTGLAAMSVEQQDYVFKMEITRDISTNTFVIGEFTNIKQLRPPAEIQVAEKKKMRLAIRMRKPVVTGEQKIENVQALIPSILFNRASSKLPEQTWVKICPTLGRMVSKSTPLQVIGYTCDLGSQQVNDALALQRATVVADLLQSHGYRVAVTMGKGKQGYVSSNPAMRHLNRRVEISILPQPANLEQ
jgi:outer membrane protein OmpA-like peptidoglycan-associated protein